MQYINEDGIAVEKPQFPQNIRFKRNPTEDWEPWFYLPPTDQTLKILRKEVHNTISNMIEAGTYKTKAVCSVFFGIPVYAFKFLNGKEIYLDQ